MGSPQKKISSENNRPNFLKVLTCITCYISFCLFACKDKPVEPAPSISSQFPKNISVFDIQTGSDTELAYAIEVKIDNGLGLINVTAPFDFDVTNVTVFAFAPMASCSLPANQPIDFTEPVHFTVSAQDGSKKDFTATITRKDQLPLEIFIDPPYNSTHGAQCGWDMEFFVFGKTLIRYRIDENGIRMKNKIVLKHLRTNTKLEFVADAIDKSYATRSNRAVGIKIPVGLDTGRYEISAIAGSQIAQAPYGIYVDYPCPVISDQPSAFKSGDNITIKGKFFFNIPPGDVTIPKLRLYKGTNFGEFTSEDFDIISYNDSIITAKSKSFIDPLAFTFAAPAQFQIMCNSLGIWIANYSKSVNVTP